MEHELSLIWGPVQNQILQFRGCSYAGRLGHRALLAKAYQKNTLDIGLDTFPSLVSISTVRECVTKTPQKPPSSRDALTRVQGDGGADGHGGQGCQGGQRAPHPPEGREEVPRADQVRVQSAQGCVPS